MKRSPRRVPLMLAALLSTSATAPAFAHDGQAVYRAQVLGERVAATATAPKPATTVAQTLLPGPYAGYLVYLGRSPEQAIAEARTRGEEPRRVTLAPPAQTQPVDGREAYERHIGLLPTLVSPTQATGLAQHDAPTLR